MGFLDDLIARADELLGSPLLRDEQPTEQFAVPHDTFDAMDWNLVREVVPQMRINIAELGDKFDYVPSMFEDMFNLLHQGDPKLRDGAAMQDRYKPNREMVAGFQKLSEMQGLRLSTMHDKYATAMAILSMQDKLTDAFTHMRSAQEAAEEAAQARAAAQQAAQDLANALADAADAAGSPEEGVAASALQAALVAAEEATAAGEQATGQADLQAQVGANKARQAMQSAAHTAAEERAEEEQMMSAYGVEPGELKRMNFEERMRLAEQLKNNRMAKFSKLIGQFRMFADAERRRKVQHKPDQVVGVELGNDLMRMTAGEMINLAAPELEDDFWRRWASNELLVFKMEGSEKLGQGPVILVCDESGSMSCEYLKGGTREAWAKALGLALCDQARRAGRDFIYIGFSSHGQQWMSVFEGGRAPIAQVIEFTEHFWGGGTYYERPLEMAMGVVLDYHADDKPKPDVVFVTDDDYGAMDPQFMAKWNQVKHRVSMRCFGVAIGCRGEKGALAAIADDVRRVDELSSDPAVMADLFRTI